MPQLTQDSIRKKNIYNSSTQSEKTWIWGLALTLYFYKSAIEITLASKNVGYWEVYLTNINYSALLFYEIMSVTIIPITIIIIIFVTIV